MTQLFQPSPPRPERTPADLGITVLCVAVVAVAVVFSRKSGACGTSHYLAFQMLGAILVSFSQELLGQTRYDAVVASALAYLLNIATFSALIRLWYVKASQERYLWGALALTGLYLLSHFFLLPTAGCP
ncbi:MAG TPA: hypothetical protein VEO55_01555 [Candidatus Dormibacteraeota bacterium]|nr:hypothetical protein [Candidatus Dormibacteraeota bacterium]